MKRIFAIIFVILGVIAIVGCSSGNSEDSTPETSEKKNQEKLTKVKVGYMPNFASINVVVPAMKTGAFEEEGIEVELVEFQDGPTIVAALESGSIDVGHIGPGAHVLPIQREADILLYLHLGNADAVIGNKELGVNSIEDLKGKKIAVAPGTSSESILNYSLDKANISKDEVELANMDASAIVTAMISGSVDAAASWSPNTATIMEELGENAIKLADNAAYVDKTASVSSYAINTRYKEENRDLLIRFVRAMYKGMDYRVENLDQVVEWVAEAAALSVDSVDDEKATADWVNSKQIVEMIESGEMEEQYKTQQKGFITEGRLEEDDLIPVSDYVLFDIMLEAAESK